MANRSFGFRLTCKQAHRLISEGMDSKLPLSGRLRLRLHLTACDACTRFDGQMLVLREAMRFLSHNGDGVGETP
jgi:hypothetical protein